MITVPFTKAQLIEQGFLPNARRAKMIIPFNPVSHCTPEQYARLPASIQKQYNCVAERMGETIVLHSRK